MTSLQFLVSILLVTTFGYVNNVEAAMPWEPEQKYDEYWLGRHETFLNITRDSIINNQPIQVIFYGDSITQDWAGSGWWVWDSRYASLPSVNYAIGSEQTQNILWRIINGEIDGISPKLVVLKIGTNNLGDYANDDIVWGITTIVQTLRERLPSTKVLVLGILPRSNSWPEVWPRVVDVNLKIARLDNGNTIRFLDMWTYFAQAWGEVVPELYTNDQLHLTTAGYEKWGEVMDTVFNEMLNS